MTKTTIRLPIPTIDRLVQHKRYGWTYDKVVKMLLDFYESNNEKQNE